MIKHDLLHKLETIQIEELLRGLDTTTLLSMLEFEE